MVDTRNKNFVAIGKIIFETPGYSWNIPHNHFIVNKTESGNYEATNLDLILDAIGTSLDEVTKELVKLTVAYVMEIMKKGTAHDELIQVVRDAAMEDYWKEYRTIEFELSRDKRDMSHNMDRHWVAAIKETMDEHLKKIIYEKAKKEAESVYTAIKSMLPDSISMYVEYRDLEAA
jgi:hypothetical protein